MDEHPERQGHGDRPHSRPETSADLSGLLDESPGPRASTENLTGVLRRHSRMRRRFTAGLASAALIVGAGGGVVVAEALGTATPAAVGGDHGKTPARSGGGSKSTGPTAARPLVPLPTSTSDSAVAAPSGLSWQYGNRALDALQYTADSLAASAQSGGASTKAAFGSNVCTVLGCGTINGPSEFNRASLLFVRSANGVTVRAFSELYESTPVLNGALPRFYCSPTTALVLEVSDHGAVSILTVPGTADTSKPFEVVEDFVAGVGEGSPMAVVAVRTGPTVSSVAARFSSGASDSMSVVDGWAVLMTSLPSSAAYGTGAIANVAGYNSSGQKVAQFQTPTAPSIALPLVCEYNYPVSSGGGHVPVTGHSGP